MLGRIRSVNRQAEREWSHHSWCGENKGHLGWDFQGVYRVYTPMILCQAARCCSWDRFASLGDRGSSLERPALIFIAGHTPASMRHGQMRGPRISRTRTTWMFRLRKLRPRYFHGLLLRRTLSVPKNIGLLRLGFLRSVDRDT